MVHQLRLVLKHYQIKKSAEFKQFSEIVKDKFASVDASTLDKNNQDFGLPVSISKDGVVKMKKAGTYVDYLSKNVLQTTIKPIAAAAPNFVNQYIEYDKTHPEEVEKEDEVETVDETEEETVEEEVETLSQDELATSIEAGKTYFLKLKYKDGKVNVLKVEAKASPLTGFLFTGNATTPSEKAILANMMANSIETTDELNTYIMEYTSDIASSALLTKAPVIVEAPKDTDPNKNCGPKGNKRRDLGNI